ncbi:hypothetical protein VCR29J2_960228 [Vibrio coralliirubri]|nr:hypothetical protein VCR29J2_960228 [Vibrio coralliirubri]
MTLRWNSFAHPRHGIYVFSHCRSILIIIQNCLLFYTNILKDVTPRTEKLLLNQSLPIIVTLVIKTMFNRLLRRSVKY